MNHKMDTGRRRRVPSQEDALRHQKEFYENAFKLSDKCPFGEGVAQELHWEKRVAFAREFIKGGDRVLDIGCGDGTVTRKIGDLADRVVGIDLSEECIRRAVGQNSHPRIEYVCSSLEAYVPADDFDAILMYEVIEHVYDPQAVLVKANRWLRNGGRIVLSTPNFSSLVRRIKRLFNPLVQSLGYKGADELAAEHICEYTFSELINLLRGAGFEIIRTDGIVLLFPFIEVLKKMTGNKFIHRLNFQSGRLFPPLALEVYLAAKKVRGVDS